jgi:hypothetical protein
MHVVPPSQTSGSTVFNNQSTWQEGCFQSPNGRDGTLRPLDLESMSPPTTLSIIPSSPTPSFLIYLSPHLAHCHCPCDRQNRWEECCYMVTCSLVNIKPICSHEYLLLFIDTHIENESLNLPCFFLVGKCPSYCPPEPSILALL